MRVLYLSSHAPVPGLSGGREREYQILSRVHRRHAIEAVIVSRNPNGEDDPALAACFDGWRLFPSPEPMPIHPPGTMSLPYQVRRNASAAAARAVREALKDRAPDVIHCEGYYMLPLVPQNCATPVVLIEQNLEYRLERQFARSTGQTGFAEEAAKVLAHERAAWRRAAEVGFLTDEECRWAHRLATYLTPRLTPNGCPQPQWVPPPEVAAGRPALLLPGNFDYGPTEAGALFFLYEVMPIIRQHVPATALMIVGAKPSDRLRAAGARFGALVTGRVQSLSPWFARADLVVCPLFVGGGIKMKMLDAIAHGQAIVTTPVGAQGLAAVRGAFAVASDRDSLAGACVELLLDRERRDALAARCRVAATRLPSWDDAAASVEALYEKAAGGPIVQAFHP